MSPKIVKGQIWVHRYLMSLALIKKLNRKESQRVWQVMVDDPSGEGPITLEFIKNLESKEDRKGASEELKKMVEEDKEDFYKCQ